jgi:hypothetical protein
MNFKHLIQGIDTIECAYYLMRLDECQLDFTTLAIQKDSAGKRGKPIKLGSEEFSLASHGTLSGYTFLIENDVFIIQFGEIVKPNFFVKFRSVALWHHGALALHFRFLNWAASIGMVPYQDEKLSRVDFAFDYQISELDFDEDNFLSTAKKDHQYRKNGKIQTFQFGKGQIVLRMYNKTDEIEEKSNKTWLYDIWGVKENVWRIEWQVRKQAMRMFAVSSFQCLVDGGQADIVNQLITNHTKLKIKGNDSNRSRWALHPLWLDLADQVKQMKGLGEARTFDKGAHLDQILTRIAISMYGNLKKVAAIDALYKGESKSYVDEAFLHLQDKIMELHDPLTWQTDVDKRVNQMRFSE